MEYFGIISDDNIVANQDSSIGVDFSFFSNGDAKNLDDGGSVASPAKTTKKKAVIKDSSINGKVENGELVNPIQGSDVAEVNYYDSYNETNNLIRGAIVQADQLAAEIKEDIDAVRASKTLKNKYTYVTNLTASASSLLTTKISAIKELNSTITQAHNLNLNRLKTMKIDENDKNDDMTMMNLYSSFINTPIGTYTPPAPSIQDITIGVNSQNPTVNAVEMVASRGTTENLTPEQNRMRMEANSNIQVVVRYDQSTGQRCFDVIDKNNGMSIPNYPRPDNFLLEDTTIDIHAGIARNRNINAVWPLMLDGSNTPIIEY